MSKEKHWAVRTVRDGAIRLVGKTFRPVKRADETYDGRFDGQRFLFGLYKPEEGRKRLASLSCTERDYRDPENSPDWGKPPVCVNGVFEFMFWEDSE